ncbi:hypothetical protein MATL_G00150820 [Megalops atlanticus]|uniref:Uncharacterized protein n=1 Tax=Megalops atlanticus TaxID=7932 RepID=A0A9D3PS43_MEGAT|nr:hypothetical protein MATL_G00150820 [Megalops atlanticus]
MAKHGATCYVVRKIRASVAEGEEKEKPIFTPCSLAKEKKKEGSASGSEPQAAMLTPDPDVDTTASAAQLETSVQKCGS